MSGTGAAFIATFGDSLSRVLALVCFCILGGESCPAVDCNENGVPDERDVAPLFAVAECSDAGGETSFLAAVDLDGDGRVDAVALDPYADEAIVLLNLGRGAFAPPAKHAVGRRPAAAAAFDFDGDGDLDLAVANEGSSDLSVLQNAGKGRFMAAFSLPAPDHPKAVIAADLNGDGQTDLAVAASYFLHLNSEPEPDLGIVLVFLNQFREGAGFQLKGIFTVGIEPVSIASGDLDGDGDPDLAVANLGARAVSLLLNDGSGSFDTKATPDAAENLSWVSLGDLDADGDLDLAVSSYSESSLLSVFRNRGSGKFELAGSRSLDGPFARLAAADFNADGAFDLVAGDYVHNTVSVFLARGSLEFQESVRYAGGPSVASPAAGDFDGDGDADLLTAGDGSQRVCLARNRGDGTFAAARAVGEGLLAFAFFAGDLDGDGDPDLAAPRERSPEISIFINDGAGEYSPSGTYAAGRYTPAVIGTDLDADGDPDLAAATHHPSHYRGIAVLRNDGKAAFSAPLELRAGLNPSSVAAGDLDANGSVDLVLGTLDLDGATESGIWIFQGLGGGAFAPATASGVGTYVHDLEVADLDGDGDLDLAAAAASGVWVLRNAGDATFPERVRRLEGSEIFSLAVSDLDGDGDFDLAAADASTASVAVLHNSGNAEFARAQDLPAGKRPASVTPADLDGDGDADLALVDREGGGDSVLVLVNAGNGLFFDPPLTLAIAGAFFVATSDVDRDGKPDLAVTSGKTILLARNQWGTRSPDADRDGVPDECGEPSGPKRFRRGDADAAGSLNIADAVRILGFLFRGDEVPPCLDAADADDSGGLSLTDAVVILNYLFLGAREPAPPGPGCGTDPTPDLLPDCSTAGCEA